MSFLRSPRRSRRSPRGAVLVVVVGLVLSTWIAGCGSVANKTDSGAGGTAGTGGSGGTGGSTGDGGIAGTPGRDGAAGAPGDAAIDQVTQPPPDGGDAGGGTGARWDISNWDNAQWN